MFFTFGKYSGHKVSETPTTYLVYALEHFGQLDLSFKDCLRQEIAQRLAIYYGHAQVDNAPVVDRKTISGVFRKLCFTYHPDKGGHPMAQAALNEFYSELLALTSE